MDRVELVGAVTSVEHHPGTGILNRKAKHVKFNGNRIFTCKRTNGNKIFNYVGETSTLERYNGMELEGKAAWPT